MKHEKQILNQIKELAPELFIEGDSVDNSDGQIENWLQNVGLNKKGEIKNEFSRKLYS